MTTIARATTHVTGLPRRAGARATRARTPPSACEAAVLATCERAFGSASLRGRSVAVVGLGHVGLRVARLLARRGAQLLVADIDPAKREQAGRSARAG